MMKLVDTSVWIRHFSSTDPFDLRSLCPVERRIICLPIYQEILQGIRDETVFRRIREALDAATMVENPLPRDRYFEAAQLFRAARRQGLTVRSSVDCLIAACAIHHNLPVLHTDRDFSALTKVSVLQQEAVPI
jgi:predicted nucleic acid-binding protein